MNKRYAILGLLAATMSTAFIPSMASNKIKEINYQSRKSDPLKLTSNLLNHSRIPGHPINIQPKKRHTNRLRSRKQAKLRAKRKAK